MINYGQTGGSWSSPEYTVSKYSSSTRWNWGLMLPVCRFLTRPTVMACRGDATKYWDILDLGIHLGNLFKYFSPSYRKYSGHPHGWSFCRAIWDDLELVHNTYGYRPLEIWVIWLCKWKEWDIYMGQMIFLLREISLWNTNSRLAREIRHAPYKCSMSYARILHVYSLVSIGTLAQILKIFVTSL